MTEAAVSLPATSPTRLSYPPGMGRPPPLETRCFSHLRHSLYQPPWGLRSRCQSCLPIRQSQVFAMATSLIRSRFWFGAGDLPGTSVSDGVETSPAGTAPLLSAGEALAVPAAFGVVQSLPAVDSDSAVQRRGGDGVLGQEPFRFLQGDPQGPHAGQDPGDVVQLLGRGHPVQLGQELLAIPPAVLRRQGQRS
jgi:hypothetical protein